MYKRIVSLALSSHETCFLWGPRQTGKSTLLKQLFPETKVYDLLLSGEYQRLLRNPGILREECQANETLRVRTAPPPSSSMKCKKFRPCWTRSTG